MADRLLFSVAGARGIVGRTIDEDVVARLTRAFCAVMPGGAIVVGRDTRPSGEAFDRTVLDAVTSSGRDCIHLGIATTPTVELVTENTGAAGGIIVTASHNPVEWNALKFLDEGGTFIRKSLGDRLYAAYESGDVVATDGRAGEVRVYENAAREHADAILALDAVDADAIRRRGFKVVLDCINGAGSVIVPGLLRDLGAEVVEINCGTNGDFYRDPEPRPENLSDLADAVRESGADIGFATDPDADRLALVDETGTAISEEYTLALAVDHVLSATRGPVVVNMSTSSVVDAVARIHDVEVQRTPVGEAHVVERMLSIGGVIGGEGNGGVIYPALHPGRDAPLGVALILQLLASRDVSLSAQAGRYPAFCMTKAKVQLEGDFDAGRIADLIGEHNPDTIDTQDGVKALFSDGWFHLRVSNTEGVVRVIAESGTAEGARAHQDMARRILAVSWGKG